MHSLCGPLIHPSPISTIFDHFLIGHHVKFHSFSNLLDSEFQEVTLHGLTQGIVTQNFAEKES